MIIIVEIIITLAFKLISLGLKNSKIFNSTDYILKHNLFQCYSKYRLWVGKVVILPDLLLPV